MANSPVELVVVNARVLTMDPQNPVAEAIAVSEGRIVAVGSTKSVSAMAQTGTKTIDAMGGSMLPGFIEAHMHLFAGASELGHLQLIGVQGIKALGDAVRNYASTRNRQALLIGQGCDYTILGELGSVTRHHLDSILPDQPLIVYAPDHHTAWANTKALELGGILHGAHLGPGNEIVMGTDTLATGELREGEAFGPVMAAVGPDRTRLGLTTGGEPDPCPDADEFRADMDVMRLGLDWCARHGITSIQNMDGNLYSLEVLAAILEQDGALKCRVKIPFHFKNFMKIEALEKAASMAEKYAGEWLTSGMVKVFFDGVLDSWTAVMVEPYADKPGYLGDPLFTPQAFAEVAVEADRRGLQIAVHAIGDGAVRAVLDGYQAAAKANGTRDARHRIEHIELIHPADIGRFQQLGVIASMQPSHPPGAMDFPMEPTVARIGKSRWPYAYASRTLKNAGAHVVYASDWPVADIDPIRSIKAAVTRKPWSAENPDQSFTLHEAIAAYTIEGAFAEFTEASKGRIKPGFMADLVILERDIEALKPAEIDQVKVAMTICAGKITFQR